MLWCIDVKTFFLCFYEKYSLFFIIKKNLSKNIQPEAISSDTMHHLLVCYYCFSDFHNHVL